MDQQAQALPVKFGKLELLEQIGAGGLALVYRGLLRGVGGFQRAVAVKHVREPFSADAQFVKTFLEEVRRAALLDHPNIAPIYDFGVIDGTCFVSVEYIVGLTLRQIEARRSKRTALPAEAAALITFQVCTALAYIHSLTRKDTPLKLLHRDVCPSNIMISKHGDVKLLDFGLIEAVSEIRDELARSQALGHKWSYAPPERIAGAPLTAQADVFSLGVVLWELLAGRSLFTGPDEAQTQTNVAHAKAPPPSSSRPGLSRALDRICARALAKQPAERFASAEAMAEQLWRYLHENPYSNADLSAFVATLPAEPLPAEHIEEPTPLRSAAPAVLPAAEVFDDGQTQPSLMAFDDIGLTSEPLRRKRALIALLAMALLIGTATGLFIYHHARREPAQQWAPSRSTPSVAGSARKRSPRSLPVTAPQRAGPALKSGALE